MPGIEGTKFGRYELQRRIARGGMSEVYLGYDHRVQRQIAVKVLYGSDEPFIRRFEREALAVGTLSHDHILPLFDFGEQSPWYYLVMPYIEGGTLRDYLDEHKQLSLQEAGSFLTQLASALHYAHEQGMVHRDVKPSNILLRPDHHLYLADFGLAKALLESEALTYAGTMVGTPEYMAPEQSIGINDYRSDIYALGIILYQMLTGRVPFTAETPVATSLKHIQDEPPPPRALNETIPPAIEAVILKSLAKDPAERYQKAMDLSTAYQEAILQSAETSMEREQREQRDGKKSARGSRWFALTMQAVHILPRRVEWPPLSRAFSLLLICFLLVLSLPMAVFWQNHLPTQDDVFRNQILTQSFFHQQTATTTTHVHAQATLAAQARVQATAGVTSAVEAGNVLYAHDMHTPGGGWIDDGSQCYFSSQGYHVFSAQTHSFAWCYSARQTFSDATITAQATLLRGDSCGLVFRLSPENRAFYVLELNYRGEFRFVRAQGSDPLTWLTLIDWTHSAAIHSGYGQFNTFLVTMAGHQFRFYVNKQLVVTSFSDTSYTSGYIGLLVGGDNESGTEAIFNNVWVFQH